MDTRILKDRRKQTDQRPQDLRNDAVMNFTFASDPQTVHWRTWQPRNAKVTDKNIHEKNLLSQLQGPRKSQLFNRKKSFK